MFDLAPLSKEKYDLCRNTISSNAFYLMVGDALSCGMALSVVRMADGERHLLEEILSGIGDREWMESPVTGYDDAWMKRMGVYGITRRELHLRLIEAAKNCEFFAPSLSGIHKPEYEMHSFFPPRDRYVDNFFPNAWTDEMKINLYRKAGHVLFIHCNPNSAAALKLRLENVLGVKVSYIQMAKWQDAEGVVAEAAKNAAPLVIFSAGPANKFIGPRIAHEGRTGKVTLDIGQASDRWLLEHLHKEAVAKKAQMEQTGIRR
jgi:hypothetical protein